MKRHLLTVAATILASQFSHAAELDFRASEWVQIVDGFVFEHLVLDHGKSRILLPKLPGYSKDASADKLTLYRQGSELSISIANEASARAMLNGASDELRTASHPPIDANSDTKLVKETTDDFAARNWKSFAFHYSRTSYGRPLEVWVGYLAVRECVFLVKINADPKAFLQTKKDAVEMLMQLREVDGATFERQATRR